MKVAFTTLGCRTNQHDTAEMQTLLEEDGFSIIDPKERADIYVVNTCTVTQKSDYNSRLAVKKSLAINENAMVVFTGCYAQMNPEEALALPGMDIVLGNSNKLEIASVIRKKLFGLENGFKLDEPYLYMTDINAENREFTTIPVSHASIGKTKAFIKVQTGCDEDCSFCTVTLARGRSISDSRENVLNNVREAVRGGYKEITLTGINLGTYGMEKVVPETFSSLVADVVRIPGDYRVRISSINPMEIDDDLIHLIADTESLCPHLHIPLQSGDDTILKAMRRNYNSGQYRDVVERAVKDIPDLGLGADVIVGFPGETEAMFERTLKIVEDLPFSYLHVFSYSPRNSTDSAELKNDVPNAVKKERNKILTDLAKNKGLQFRKNFSGQSLQVLVENQRDTKTKDLKGHSENFIPVHFEGDNLLMNRLVSIRVQEVTESRVSGCVQ